MGNVKKNIFYNMGYQILILIVPFITSPYVSRVLGPEGLGTYSVTTAIVKYFTLFALLGMTNYGNRTIAKNKDSKEKLSVTFWNLYYFQLMSSTIVLIAYIMYLISAGIDNYGWLVYVKYHTCFLVYLKLVGSFMAWKILRVLSREMRL